MRTKMMNNAFYITAAELAQKGFENTPDELLSAKHLIYSSPATLAFNSPGAQGFGVKRAGLAIPGSVMLLVSPGCCGRNTTMQSRLCGYQDRFFYLLLDDTDIVTGRHLTKIPEAVKEVYEFCDKKPSAVMICITCVDALLGTDMERVSRKCEELAGVPVVPCYMYALTREKKLPPMAAVRKAVYSLLKPQKRHSDSMNILGHFAPLNDDCEMYELLTKAGIKHIREISRCEDFEEYEKMSQANFNLVLNQEARHAAADLQKRLGIPSVELARLYRTDKIANQYRLLGQAVGMKMGKGVPYFRGIDPTVEDAKTNLSYNTIHAPMDGTVYALVVSEGQTVNSAQTTPTILRLANLDEMKIKTEISEADVVNVKKGMDCTFTVLGLPYNTFYGKA